MPSGVEFAHSRCSVTVCWGNVRPREAPASLDLPSPGVTSHRTRALPTFLLLAQTPGHEAESEHPKVTGTVPRLLQPLKHLGLSKTRNINPKAVY